MMRAVEEYFPDSNITADLESNGDASRPRDEESAPSGGLQTYALNRVNTGVTSLVGSTNGQRPGGYILVIDGLALTDVSSS
jgi:phospholipid-translocating ATPase